MHPPLRYVGVIGKGDRCPNEIRWLALEAGSALARMRPAVVLVCGGLGGVMDNAARGMTEAGGVAIGLLPQSGTPSAHLTYAVRTGLPENHRNIITASAADLLVVLPGSHGTLIEAWAGADRHLPLVGMGDHEPWPTAALPFTATTDPTHLPEVVAHLLGMPSGVG